MEEVIDKLVAEVKAFAALPYASGGCADVLAIQDVYFGDPGVLPMEAYPAVTVSPGRDVPDKETTGFEVRNLEVFITVLIDAREYFDATVEEASGDRELVRTMFNLRRWLRGTANRQLDHQPGVREVVVQSTDYLGQVRGSVIAKTAQTSLLVNKQYSRQA